MHMADALLSPAVAGTMYAASGIAAGYSIKKGRKYNQPEKIPVMGVTGAFVFAAQMINFTILGTGSSGHLCGGMLLAGILGPEAGFLTMIGILFIQCLLFADGGLLAFGANVWNMAFYGCFAGGMIIWRLFMKNGMSKGKIIAASVLGSIVSLQLGAFSVTLETLASNITELPFPVFVSVMQPIHLVIGLVEGLITAAVLVFVYEARPQLLWCYHGNDVKNRISPTGIVAIFAVVAAVIAGLVSLYASAFPDGLEWSIEKVAKTAEPGAFGGVYDIAGKIQNAASVLPDYQFAGNTSPAGTSFSGMIGGIVVFALCIALCYGLKLFRKKKSDGQA